MLESNPCFVPFSRDFDVTQDKIATVLTVEGGEAVEGTLFQIFGMGPDSFYYALYQWGSDAMDWINRGLLDNNIYSNAHNEWLTLLVQQGILGVIAYGGIFLTAFRNLRISATRDPRALAVFLGLTGYLICSLFTFQHVLSTPFAFALLGMAEGVFM